VLGWHSQVEALIRSDRLVRVGEMEIPAPGSFFLTWDENRPLSEAAERLRDWLLEAGREFTEPQAVTPV
jgi:LysR family glycine cleavage system transcriptional activator